MAPNDRLTLADALACEAHAGQVRKGTDIPYVEHPRGVAALVKAYGGSEDQQIAALLHDVLEDGGAEYLERVATFGPDVLRMVRDCSDCIPEAGAAKAPWQDRKDAYIAHLQTVQDDSNPTTSVSMTINGPAPIILAMFFNTALEQQLVKFRTQNGREPTED